MPQPHFSIADGPAQVPPVYFDAYPLSDPHLTGIGRYTARLALAMAAFRPVRFFLKDRVVTPPGGLDWSQDQDLAAWARSLMRGEKSALGSPPAGSIGVYPLLRPIERAFD